MTVLAWDGKTLAADRRMVSESMIGETTKLFTTSDGEYIVGVSGTAEKISETRAWFESGRDPAKYPGDEKASCFVLAVHQSGRVEKYNTTGWPIVVEQRFLAMGSGRDCAMAALHLGHDARKAVEVASALLCCCGNGIDFLTFTDGA